MRIEGRVWKFGDGIDTDIIIPARYLIEPIQEMKWKAMKPVRPDFARQVNPGDIILGGSNFGCGSSREQAPAVLKALGIRAITAVSFRKDIFTQRSQYRTAGHRMFPMLMIRFKSTIFWR